MLYKANSVIEYIHLNSIYRKYLSTVFSVFLFLSLPLCSRTLSSFPLYFRFLSVPSNSAWGHVVEDVRLLLNGFISWKSSYCIPLVNKPARALARHARNCDEIVIWMEDFFFFLVKRKLS